ncbi:MAG: cation transporter [Bacteroidetes bacterium]|uniref:Cation transporter n=1 Tax=Candidatus Egerieousia excrementavium TaxID=2840778 RepID=A0A9D9DKZ9_9BACT|nr:cation transporter [Candidatus Egerieousia excrementavium]
MGDTDKSAGKQILRASYVSVIGNGVLSAAKIIAGALSGSFAVISDGIDSASDVAMSVVMIVTAKIMGRKPNRKYVYGYAKAELIATKILSMLIFFAGAEMFVSAIRNLFSEQERILPGRLAIYVTVASILCKLLLSLYQTATGRKTGSSMLIANGINMRNDVVISLSVLVGLFFSFVLELPVLDSVTALLVSCFIVWSAVRIFMDSNTELMDGVKDVTVYQKIFDAIEKVDGIKNTHRVRSRSIGNKYMITLDVEADGNMTLNQAHALTIEVEQRIRESIPEVYDIVVHIEPFGTHPEEVFGVR